MLRNGSTAGETDSLSLRAGYARPSTERQSPKATQSWVPSRTNKEYQAVLKEIDDLKRQSAKIEDQMLESCLSGKR